MQNARNLKERKKACFKATCVDDVESVKNTLGNIYCICDVSRISWNTKLNATVSSRYEPHKLIHTKPLYF